MTNDPPDFADRRLHSPAAERNRAPILAQLQRLLPLQGRAIEIASGTGQHVAHFAACLPGWHWQPTDSEPQTLASIDAWCDGLANVHPARHLDVLAAARDPLPNDQPEQVDVIYCANLLHISPWGACAALMQLAARHLTASGVLLLYGPYLEDAVPTAPSNLAFDADLRARDGAWGLRQLADVLQQARAVGLRLRERVPMAANNLLLVLERATPSLEDAA